MDALVPAFVLALLLLPGNAVAAAAARLATRTGRPLATAGGAALGMALGCAAAGAAGAALHPRLTPEAARLMLGLAILAGGIGLLLPGRRDTLDGWRLGAFGTGVAGIGSLALGGSVHFVVFALALATGMPALAALGAALASAGVLAVAAATGERAWHRLPLRGVRWGACGLLAAAGLVVALGALGLV